ncbi:hypothetical protein C3V36_11390 [Lachnospiraceae bacterium oral taxon 500]|nr:hypothetical protein C3V36_11390 [Lachnospiraceae bacterium oral taxon 500]
MKKLIGIVAIVTLVAMLGTVVSFLILDLHKFVNAGSRLWTQYRDDERVREALEEAGDQLETALDKVSDGLEQSLETVGDTISDKIDNLEDYDWGYDFIWEMADQLMEKGGKAININQIFEKAGAADGYLTAEEITRNHKKILEKWTQPLEGTLIKEIKVDADDINLVIGRTKAREIEVYLAGSDKQQADYRNDADWKITLTDEGEYQIFSRSKNNKKEMVVWRSYVLYLLLPDEYQAEVEADIINGNVVGVWQQGKTEIEVTNGNVILNQMKNNDLSVKLTNGNIIASLPQELNAKLEVKVTNGLIIGFGGIPGRSHKAVYGQGQYEIDLETINGNIIGN